MELYRLKIHQNNQFLLFVDVSVSIRDHQKKKLVLVLSVLGTTNARTWTWRAKKAVVCQESEELVPASSDDEGLW